MLRIKVTSLLFYPKIIHIFRELERLYSPDFDDHKEQPKEAYNQGLTEQHQEAYNQGLTEQHQEPYNQGLTEQHQEPYNQAQHHKQYNQEKPAQYPHNNPSQISVLLPVEAESDSGRLFSPVLGKYASQKFEANPAVDPSSNFDQFQSQDSGNNPTFLQFEIKESKVNTDANRFALQESPEVNEVGLEEPESDEESHKSITPTKSILNTIFGNIRNQLKQPKHNKNNQVTFFSQVSLDLILKSYKKETFEIIQSLILLLK